MAMPPQGFSRPVLASVESVGADGQVRLRLARELEGIDWALAELRVQGPPQLAVPLAALIERDGAAKVYVMAGEHFEPRAVTVTARGESYAAVEGLAAGETVAGSGLFWLDAEWRLAHPQAP
jgi:hypothetical protein